MSRQSILVGVSGGIAAYKAAALVSLLVQDGLDVAVIQTDASRQFVGSATFAALSGQAVASNLFDDAHYPLGAHIDLTQRSHLLCIAPASANILAKMARGLADDLLSTAYLCFQGPVIVAPAMNNHMWCHPSVQRNVAQLRDDGVGIVDPDDGWLSCRQFGPGRMAEPNRILAAVRSTLTKSDPSM